jgi:hypothetical protein
MTLALAAWVSRGRQPAASISSAIQYGGTVGEILEEGLDSARFVVDPGLALELAILI